MANGHGGSRPPERPAGASGPGKFSQRTDSKADQPVRAYQAEKHGDRQRLINQQRMAPLEQAGGPPAPQPTAPGQGGGGVPRESVFGPTNRPGEPPTAGLPFGPGAGPLTTPQSEAEDIIRAAFQMTNDPYLLKLLQRVMR